MSKTVVNSARAGLLGLVMGLLHGCGNGAAGAVVAVATATILAASAAAPTVPLVVFPGNEAQKPAALLPFTAEASAVAASADGRKLYVGDTFHHTVTVMDTATRRVTAIWDAPTGPRFVTVTPDDSLVLVTGFGTQSEPGDQLALFDAANAQRTATLTTGSRPFAIAVSADSRRAYVANLAGDSITVVDLTAPAVSATIDAGAGFAGDSPAALALAADGDLLLVASRDSHNVTVIDTATGQATATITVGTTPVAVAVHPEEPTAYVSNRDDGTVSVLDLDTFTVRATLAVGDGPMGLAVSPDGERIYVADAFGGREDDLCGLEGTTVRNQVYVIDTSTEAVLADTVAVGPAPIALVIAGDQDKLYAVSACADAVSGTGRVTRIRTTDVTDTAVIDTAGRGTAAALAAGRGELYVAHPHAVSIISVADDAVAATLPVRGAGPTKLAFSPDGGKLYGLRPGVDGVSVIDVDSGANTEQILATLSVGSRPSDLAVLDDPAGIDQVYVTNAGFSRQPDHTVSVIDVAPAGSAGSVSNTISLEEPGDSFSSLARGPVDIAISADGSQAWVAGFGDFFPNSRESGQFVSIIDTATATVTNIGDYGEWPLRLALDNGASLGSGGDIVPGAGSVAHVGAFLDDQLVRADLADPDSEFVAFVEHPGPLAVADHRAYVAGYRTQNAGGVDQTTLVEVALTGVTDLHPVAGVNPGFLAVTPDQGAAYVLHRGDRGFLCGVADDVFCSVGTTVSVVALPFVPGSGDKSITVGRGPSAIAFAPDLPGIPQRAVVSNYFDGTVSIIEPWAFPAADPRVIATLDVGQGPLGVVVNPPGTRAYVANSVSNTLSVIALDRAAPTVVRTLDLNP